MMYVSTMVMLTLSFYLCIRRLLPIFINRGRYQKEVYGVCNTYEILCSVMVEGNFNTKQNERP